PPDAAVRGPGHVRRHPRRRQPRLEARPRPARRGGAGGARRPRSGNARARLDAYEAERRETVRAVIDFSMSLGKVICVTDPAEAEARDAMLLDGAAAASGPQAAPPLPGGSEGGIAGGGDL